MTQKDLSLLNVKTIGDLSRLPKDLLRRRFGQQGLQLYFLSKGIDDREVQPERIIKSIGREETFAEDILDQGKGRERDPDFKSTGGQAIKEARRRPAGPSPLR